MSRTDLTLAAAAALLLAGSALAGPTLAAQEPAPNPMEKLAFLVGQWQGEAWIQMGPEKRDTVQQKETIEWALEGEVLLIRGVGTESGAGGEKVVHNAVATLAWDPLRQAYSMWTYAAGRGVAQPEVEVGENRLVWSMTVAGGRRVRYTARLDEQGRWVETGETSTDEGATWHPFLGMTLTRQ